MRVSAGNREGEGTARGQSTAQIYLNIGRKLFLVTFNLNYLTRTGRAHNLCLFQCFAVSDRLMYNPLLSFKRGIQKVV